MAWRDQLRKGSFRNVEFFTDSTGTEGGRRLAVHEYPQRDLPYVEDLGRTAKKTSFTAYVLGPDYMTARDALIRALDEEGPGTLVHPYMGEMQVAVPSWRSNETKEEGGKCAFEISFIEAGNNAFPAATANTSALVLDTSALNYNAAAASFLDRYKHRNMPDYIIDSAATALQDVAAAVTGLRRAASGALAGDFTDAVNGLYDAAPDLARSDDIPVTIAKVLSLFRQSSADALAAQNGLRSLGDFASTRPGIYVPTANRASQLENLSAIDDLVHGLAVTEQARALLARDFVSYDDAVAARDAMTDDLESVIVSAGDRGDDAVFAATGNMKTAIVTDLTARGASLARIVYRGLGRPMNALVLAQRLYQDSSREGEIAARNGTPHPGWLPVTIEALSR